MRIVTVLGARPQFIKAAVVSAMLRRSDVDEVLVHTGQHFDDNMSAVFFDELEIARPAHNLGIAGGPHGDQTGRMLGAVESVLLRECPDRVLVYGDTNSTLAGALAAAKLHVPVAHVEAGLRSFNRRMPEEINRVLTDHLADLLFAPTPAAVENLAREGRRDGVHQVGDVMYDASLRFAAAAEARSTALSTAGVREGAYILATVHRQENTDDPGRLKAIIGGLGSVAADVPVVLPLHPRTRGALENAGLVMPAGIRAIAPVGYLDMVMLERHARLIVTDSGGVQKEACFLGVPCITLRDETEWVELVAAGWNTLAPPVSAVAVEHAVRVSLGRPAPATAVTIYGDGHAAERIVSLLSAAA